MKRRDFLKGSIGAVAASSVPLQFFAADYVFANGEELIPHATHFGPFKAVVKDGKLIGVQPISKYDAMPTEMLTKGVISRTFEETRVNYPMVRKSYLQGVQIMQTGNWICVGKKSLFASLGTWR